ncbi:MAG: hypothetical protein M0010_03160 [Actinomycetota bacterium]|nr:hypothetical protein [Actinomycetota bacterium]
MRGRVLVGGGLDGAVEGVEPLELVMGREQMGGQLVWGVLGEAPAGTTWPAGYEVELFV